MLRTGDSSAIEKRIEAAKKIVLAETRLMHSQFGLAQPETKHDGTRVTPIDIAISQNIQAALGREFPEDQFFSEELSPNEGTTAVISRFCWVLDPIDGTNNYATGIIHCAISLALLERGVPVYGVIYDLARKTLIHGGPGRGVWDGERAANAVAEPLHGNSLIGFHSPTEKVFAREAKEIVAQFKVRALGSSTLHLAYASIGLLDGVVEYNNKVWDIAAAAALVEESGAKLHYLSESPFPLREFSLRAPRVQYVCGNAAVLASLLQALGRQTS